MKSSFRDILFPVLHALGPVLMGFALTMLLPLITSWLKHDGATDVFIKGFLITAISGALLTVIFHRFRQELTARHGFLLVALAWTIMPLFAAIPLHLYLPQYNLLRCYFETISCLTTTGSTIITGLDHLPISVNSWRCLLSWMGGMGLIVLSVAILPLLGVGGAQIIKAETSGPLKETRLTPRVAETARALYLIYFGISIACAVCYHFSGMHWNDAILNMMTTVSLSGISTHDDSFGFFQNPWTEWTAIIFMIICGCNFSLHFLVWRNRNPLLYFKSTEFISFFAFVCFMVLAITGTLVATKVYPSFSQAITDVAFSMTSVATTTGYTTVDYSGWPYGIPILMVLSAAVATCAGSTGGGLKMIRVIILLKHLKREFMHLLYPQAILPLSVDQTPITNTVVTSVMTYLVLWIITVFFGTFVLMFCGLQPLEAFTGTIANITNLGPGLGAIGPAYNYSALTDAQLLAMGFLMILGRLELFTVFILFSKNFWKV